MRSPEVVNELLIPIRARGCRVRSPQTWSMSFVGPPDARFLRKSAKKREAVRSSKKPKHKKGDLYTRFDSFQFALDNLDTVN